MNSIAFQNELIDVETEDSERVERFLQTSEEMSASQRPNFLRLYLNPWVAQACVCLSAFADALLRRRDEVSSQRSDRRKKIEVAEHESDCPSFLCNSREEALSGAIKLARFTVQTDSASRRNGTVILFDPNDEFRHFATSETTTELVEFVPGIVRCGRQDYSKVLRQHSDAGVVVYASGVTTQAEIPDELFNFSQAAGRVVVRRSGCSAAIPDSDDAFADIVLFDESVVDHDVPFSAFTSRRTTYEPWMSGKMSMFHSTTFQPNTIASMHFVRRAEVNGSEWLVSLRPQLNRLQHDVSFRHDIYCRLFSPSLSQLIRVTAFDHAEPTAIGHFIQLGKRKILDGVAGVACSLGGHNRSGYVSDVRDAFSETADVQGELQGELKAASGMEHFAPAVSGAAAVEHALKLALIAQSPRRHVIALRGGFGGKTLCALTGTARDSYKTHVGPLYSDVTYVDPFRDDSVDEFRSVLKKHSTAVVQLELIQGVGGVRAIPSPMIDAIQAARDEFGVLLFVDEVQTGMFRTGPFLRSQAVGVCPDVVSIGKGASDMMFPFAATLYNDRVASLLHDSGSDIIPWLHQRYGYCAGEVTLLNTLRSAKTADWQERVRHQGELFSKLLREGLNRCRNVRDIRVFGMLMGIELNDQRTVMRMLGNRAAKLYSLAMLEHATNPLLVGFCQYEPNVFKITPGLLMSDDEIRDACRTVCETLQRNPLSVLGQGMLKLATRRKSRR